MAISTGTRSCLRRLLAMDIRSVNQHSLETIRKAIKAALM